ncbi:cardiolipin synthase [Pontibacter chinhatensis]|uniref:Cardiolipin synthase n=1 Tax=Pontibacter chinhatensis TaxID=1436961 RepID=A0A1I2XKK0_9BACT|nr:cardiolipin synthase [Pontibacter chinhatensis]SFH13945.1 cardiolipin synthase [Pontibacter chinhatensis]
MLRALSDIDWLLIGETLYLAIIILVCLRIIYDTRSSIKTLAYLLLVIFVPIGGILFYFSFGINYRKRSLYSKKLLQNVELMGEIEEKIISYSRQNFKESPAEVQQYRPLALLLLKDNLSPLTAGNKVKLLLNGEQKFAEVFEALEQARHHIHLEYYIINNDLIGNKLKELLIRKAREGVIVRLIYDDFGSRPIRRKFRRELQDAGVEVYPFHKVRILLLANRLNYRNHRKIIVVDGVTAFVGGINISDSYINYPNQKEKTYWRDTHLRIDGPGAFYLQYLFFTDWNFSSQRHLEPEKEYFLPTENIQGNTVVQIASSGPDSSKPTIMFSILQAIALAKEEILLTTPYFIPGESILDAMTIAAMGGVTVKLLVPENSDSFIVDTAARSYFESLLDVGVQIYQYRKGFIHAKTLVVDGNLSMVGTANMDYRSFDLNFEVNAVVYDAAFAGELRRAFFQDLTHATKLDAAAWKARPVYIHLFEKVFKLISPLL